MWNTRVKDGIFVIVLLETVAFTTGLQCHVCNYVLGTSDSDPMHSDISCKQGPVSTKFLKNCSDVHPLAYPSSNLTYKCIKTYLEEAGRFSVKRACGTANEMETGTMPNHISKNKNNNNFCRDLNVGRHIQGVQCQCDSDACNGSSTLGNSILNYCGALSILSSFIISSLIH